ncbi:MAG: hypothetical protein LHW48_04370 [Candidatus Cloacimonetes bacterium]|nr:hypothetical protein [Candidatus Cloacimonadota bacterium]
MRYALKEAKLQKPVLTNRNGIRGIAIRVSRHITATPKEHPNDNYVDLAVIG